VTAFGLRSWHYYICENPAAQTFVRRCAETESLKFAESTPGRHHIYWLPVDIPSAFSPSQKRLQEFPTGVMAGWLEFRTYNCT